VGSGDRPPGGSGLHITLNKIGNRGDLADGVVDLLAERARTRNDLDTACDLQG
jgi:hypothetical protein